MDEALEEVGLGVASTLSQSASKAVLRKTNLAILPLCCAISAVCYMDRTALAFASLHFTEDLKFTPQVYGLGSGLFFLGYSLFMVPSNIIMLRVGAPRWLGTLVIVWGLIAASFSLIQTETHFYSLRFLLGAAEAGAFPGMWYYLYLFYPASELTLPLSVLEAAVAVTNVVAAPLAAGLLQLEGLGGMRGWQWLFLLEGCLTLVIGVTTLVALPRDITSARFLAPAEKRWLAAKVDQATKLKSEKEAFTDKVLLLEAAGNARVWYVAVMGLFKNMAAHGMLFWCPIIVGALLERAHSGAAQDTVHLDWPAIDRRHHHPQQGHLQYNQPTSQAVSNQVVLLTSIPFVLAAVLSLVLGHRSQAHNEHSGHLAVPYLLSALLFGSFPRVAAASSVGAFLCMSAVIALVQGTNSIINSLVPLVAAGPGVSVCLALYNAVANLGGLVGPWAIGELVRRTGGYNEVFRMLGIVMGLATIMAWGTRGWRGSSHGSGSNSSGGAGSTSGSAGGAKQLDDEEAITRMLDDTADL